MEIPQSVKDLTPDARTAALRLAGRQFIKTMREPIVAFLCQKLGSDEPGMRAKIGNFLGTDMGEAVVATLLSLGLMVLPESTGHVPAILSRELRVHAMTIVGDVVTDLLMSPLRDVVSDFLRGAAPAALPQESTILTPVPDFKGVSQEAPQPVLSSK
jgi:hypothetical protein